jgi:uncharacterized protein
VFVVDTNVLVYAANVDAVDHERCRMLVERWRRGPAPWYLTWGIVYEFLRVVTHGSVFPTPWSLPEAWGFVRALLAVPSAGILVEGDRHEDVLARVVEELPALRGNLLHDAHVVALMREHGVARIVTRDADFRRFERVAVVDPLDVD